MENPVLMLTYEEGALYVYTDRIDIAVNDYYYNGSLTKEQMSSLRTVLNKLELPEDALT